MALAQIAGSRLYCILPSQSLPLCDNDSSPTGGAKWLVLICKQSDKPEFDGFGTFGEREGAVCWFNRKTTFK